MKVKKGTEQVDSSLIELLDDADRNLLESFLSSFLAGAKAKYGLKDKKLKVTLNEIDENKDFIPSSIFTEKLGILETVVKFLHENYKYTFKEIASVLKKTPNNIAVTFFKAKKKLPTAFKILDYCTKIPLNIYSKKLTCFESICVYLKSQMNYHEIGEILHRDERTIWTVYQRAIKGGRR